MTGIRRVTAPNPGPFTLDGTRTWVVGTEQVVIIDPGPDDADHVARVAEMVAEANGVQIVLTHEHADHSGGAAELGRVTGAAIRGPGGTLPVSDGDRFPTDGDVLVAVDTPGHTRSHFCYHLVRASAVFVGDLLLGEGDTTWIGEYPEGIRDYLASLDRIEALGASVLYPGHGPPLVAPADALSRFRRHRLARIEQVRSALAARPDLATEGIVDEVYGPLEDRLRSAAAASVEAILDYLEGPS